MSCYAPVVEAADCSTIGVKLRPIMRAVAPSINPVERNPPFPSPASPASSTSSNVPSIACATLTVAATLVTASATGAVAFSSASFS
jgi:hypothetical protein